MSLRDQDEAARRERRALAEMMSASAGPIEPHRGQSHVHEYMRVICNAPSHKRPPVVATFRRQVIDFSDGEGPQPHWTWRAELASGGGAIHPWTGEREWRDTLPASDEEMDAGLGDRIPIAPKRTVESKEFDRYDLECPCGLRKRIKRERLHPVLEHAHSLGASQVSLQDLVANL
jgi:hypothetical protein